MTPITIFILCFVVLFGMTAKRPVFVIGAMLSVYVIEQLAQASAPFFVANASLINLLIGAGVGFALMMKEQKLSYLALPKLKIVLISTLIYIYAGVSTFWAYEPEYSLIQVQVALPYIILYLLLATWLIDTPEDYRMLYKSVVIIGTLLLGTLLVSGKLEAGGVRIPWLHDFYGEEIRQNYLEIGKLAGLVILISLLSDIWNTSRIWRYSRWLVALLCLAISIKSGARAQTVFTLGVLVLFLPLRYPLAKVKNLLLFIIAAPILVYSIKLFLDIYWGGSNRWSPDAVGEESVGGRLQMATFLVREWLASEPLALFFGLGSSSSYQVLFPKFHQPYSHIIPAEVIAELGFVGFIMFCGVLFFYVFKFLQQYTRKFTNQSKALLLPLGAVFVYIFLLTLKQGSLLSSMHLFYFGSLIVLLKKVEQADLLMTTEKRRIVTTQ